MMKLSSAKKTMLAKFIKERKSKPIDLLVAGFDEAWSKPGYEPVHEYLAALNDDRLLQLVDALDNARLWRLVAALDVAQLRRLEQLI